MTKILHIGFLLDTWRMCKDIELSFVQPGGQRTTRSQIKIHVGSALHTTLITLRLISVDASYFPWIRSSRDSLDAKFYD